MSEQRIDFAAEGLLDGLEGDDRADRLELLERLAGEGVPLEQLRRSIVLGNLIFLGADRVIGGRERYTAAEIAELSGLPLDFLLASRRAMGLPTPEPDEAAFTDNDLDAAKRASVARAAGISDGDLMELLRVLGRGLAQAAETMRALPIKLVLQPGMSEQELALAYGRAVSELYPLVNPLLSNMLAAHLRYSTASEVISAIEASGGGLPGAREVAVCFADLVGFTRLGEEVAPDELGRLAAHLEELAADVAQAPVRLVKTIGDAAMLAAPTAEPLIDAALALIDAAERAGSEFPQLRAGAAGGMALPRAGDWFGRPVNLASRITAIARPGSLLTERSLRDAAGEGYRFSFAGEQRLRGIRERVALFRVRRQERGQEG